MQTLEDLKKEYEAKLAALKAERIEAFAKARAWAAKKAAGEKKRLRKQQNHLKFLVGGYFLAEIRQKKDKTLLDKIVASVSSEKDKKLLMSVFDTK